MKVRTFTANDQKITIKSSVATHLRNFNGFRFDINGERYHFSTLDRDGAEDKAFVHWVNNFSNIADDESRATHSRRPGIRCP